MKTAAFVLFIAACAGSAADDDEFPVLPGGGSTGAGSTGGGSSASELVGRVCVATDLRDLSSCANTGAGGLTVRAGDATTVTAADGSYRIDKTPGELAVTVSGPGIVPTTSTAATGADLTAIDADVFARELMSNAVTLDDRTGSILGTVVRGETAATGVTMTTTPTGPFGPFFDAGDVFGVDSTGTRGVFFVPGLATGSTALTFRDATSGRETTVNGIQVVNGGVTILDSVALP